MRLVLQCSTCGTVHPVGAVVCPTCRAGGIEHLRLLFECMTCFRLGLRPVCEVCSRLLSLELYEIVPNPDELAQNWGVDEVSVTAVPPVEPRESGEGSSAKESLETVAEVIELSLEDIPGDDRVDVGSEFELSLDDPPFADDDEELRLDDDVDPILEDD